MYRHLVWGGLKPGDSLELLGADRRGEITTLGYKIDDGTTGGFQLGNWVSTQRKSYNNGECICNDCYKI